MTSSDRGKAPLASSRTRGLDFLSGGGEMGELMRQLDWRSTPLGHPSGWPRSLRTTVGIMLNSKYPMFLAWGPELAFLYNDGYRPIFGEKHPAALGRPFAEAWAEIWEDIRPLVDRALAGEPTWSENLQLFMERRGFVEEVYFTFSYSPVRGDEGTIEGMFCACTETTAEVIGERHLDTLRALASETLEARSVTEACRRAEEILRANPADVPFSLLYLMDASGPVARLAACTGCRPGGSFSPEVLTVGGSEAPGWPFSPVISGKVTTLRDLEPGLGLPGGLWPEPARAVVILPLAHSGLDRDRGYLIVGVSPRLPFDAQYAKYLDVLARGVANALAHAEAYEAERKRAEELARIDNAKTVFFSNVSHEFRTPLMLMLAPLTDLLSDENELSPSIREQLDVAHRNSLRLLKLVNSLLDFSRIEAGRMQASYQPVDLAALTTDLASNFRSACEKAGIELRVDCPPLSEPVYVDHDMWEKIVLNLLSNAFKFTLEGSISVALRAETGHAVLEVRDTGIGVPTDELPRLFERFHRVEGARGRSEEGSGIGLALVRELIALHGGSIEAVSEEGAGTTMTVVVPLGSKHLPQDRIGSKRAVLSTATAAAAYVEEALRWLPDGSIKTPSTAILPQERPGAAAAPRVLVVDDNADMRDYISRLLGQHWMVETAPDGAAALEVVRRNPPELVLTDVMMPRLDGFGLVRALRTDAATAGIPVIMISARAGEEARIEGLKAGADDYLVKPFSARELIARVSSQIALRRGARERAELEERERLARRVADAQAHHLQSLFLQAPAPVVIMRGPQHVIELANQHALRIWGREQDEVLGKPLAEALPELRGQVFIELLDRVYRSGKAHIGKETRALLRGPAGELRELYVNFVYTPLYDADGAIDGVLAMAFDVTEQIEARRRTEELRREAEEASRAKDEFLAMLGHELRNPLAPILTALELMRLRGGDVLEKERALIERQSGRLVRLVDDLLDVSRIARGHITLSKRVVELSEVVANAVETVSPLLEERSHRLTIDMPPAGFGVHADPARLAQVVSNLLTNAAKYTEPGGQIAISATQEGREIVLKVSDNGMGITPELLPRVFDTFAQQSQGADRSMGGLGLGLTIVRNIVDLHGGQVTARSEGKGRGSEFIVRLPTSTVPVSVAVPASALQTVTKRQRRVLVVDDNKDAARALADYLAAIGHSTDVAHDGPAALRAADDFGPHVALLDLGLPGMDGYELARQLRERMESCPTLIAVTGYGQPSDHDRTRAAGFDAHLVKPVDLAALGTLLDDGIPEAR